MRKNVVDMMKVFGARLQQEIIQAIPARTLTIESPNGPKEIVIPGTPERTRPSHQHARIIFLLAKHYSDGGLTSARACLDEMIESPAANHPSRVDFKMMLNIFKEDFDNIGFRRLVEDIATWLSEEQ